MAQQGTGEPATCPCKAAGLIIDRAGRFDRDNWYVIEHEDGSTHVVEVYWSGEAFRFRMKEDQQ